MYDLKKIIGLKVVAVKGFERDRRKTRYIEAKFILFSDKRTYIELSKDCEFQSLISDVYVFQDAVKWKEIMEHEFYKNATVDNIEEFVDD